MYIEDENPLYKYISLFKTDVPTYETLSNNEIIVCNNKKSIFDSGHFKEQKIN